MELCRDEVAFPYLSTKSKDSFWAHLCNLHGGLVCIIFCLSGLEQKNSSCLFISRSNNLKVCPQRQVAFFFLFNRKVNGTDILKVATSETIHPFSSDWSENDGSIHRQYGCSRGLDIITRGSKLICKPTSAHACTIDSHASHFAIVNVGYDFFITVVSILVSHRANCTLEINAINLWTADFWLCEFRCVAVAQLWGPPNTPSPKMMQLGIRSAPIGANLPIWWPPTPSRSIQRPNKGYLANHWYPLFGPWRSPDWQIGPYKGMPNCTIFGPWCTQHQDNSHTSQHTQAHCHVRAYSSHCLGFKAQVWRYANL